jgi:hypothetical protein
MQTNLTPIVHSNNCCLRQHLGLTTNFGTQNWAQLSRGNPHLHSSLPNLMSNAGYEERENKPHYSA